jgi:3',5'-cyclic AMP phosphodiesterase CpdA
MKRVIQISDTHLSGGKRHFAPNWAPLRDWVVAQSPDYVIHTGDVTVDGADVDDDLAFCAALLRELPVPVLVVPGNHDVGEPGPVRQPIDAARIARWRRHFGPDWWSLDIEGWRLVGLDAMLFGSGLPQEDEQHAWLDATLAAAGDRTIAWFMHRPLFLEHPDEGDSGYWAVKPATRAPLVERVRKHGVALVATGHLHQMQVREHGGCRYVFGPSSGFVVSEARQGPMPGHKKLGAIVYDFDGTSVDVRAAELPALERFFIDDVIDEVYPARRVV